MLPLFMLVFVVSGLAILIVAMSVICAFLSTNALFKLHTLTDDWRLWPINKITAWFIEARQFRSRDG